MVGVIYTVMTFHTCSDVWECGMKYGPRVVCTEGKIKQGIFETFLGIAIIF